MAKLITQADLLSFTDKLAAYYDRLNEAFGLASDPVPARGTLRRLADLALAIPVDSDSYEQQADLNKAAAAWLDAASTEANVEELHQVINSLQNHAKLRGGSVDASITSLQTYLSYLNATPYTAMLAPGFQDAYKIISDLTLTASMVFHRGISPDLNATLYPNGMGSRAVGGSFSAGSEAETALYAAVNPVVVVTADFAGGSGAPTVTIAGEDDTGATSTTWTAAVTGGNNPASAVSTTVTPAVNAQERQTVAVGSLDGIVAGSVLTVDAGLTSQETVVVEAVDTGATTITAVFQKAHTAGATLAGRRTLATTPSVAGRRLVSVAGVTIGITGHSAGTVRVDGRQERVPV